MKNRIAIVTLRMLGIAAIVAVIACIAGTHSASAQCCPTYTAQVNTTVPAGCFPMVITTTWSNGISGSTAHAVPNSVVVAAPVPPGCWLFPIVAITINGVGVPVPALGTCVPAALPCGVVKVCVLLDPTGCPMIVVR